MRQEEQLYLARSCFDSCSRYFWRIFGAGEIHATHTHTHTHQEKERTMTTKQHRKKKDATTNHNRDNNNNHSAAINPQE